MLQWKCEHGLRPYSALHQERFAHRFNLDHFDVDYSIKFDDANRGLTTDICLDDVESRYLLAANADGSLLIFDTQEPSESGDGSVVFPVVARMTTVHPSVLPARLQATTGLSPSRCLQWNPVDTGSFISVSFDKTLKIWDTNRCECVEAIETPEAMLWASVSPCAVEHNLIAVALHQCQERQAVLIDPLLGAVSLSLRGGHSQPVMTQVAWSARNSFTIITAGEDGRILFWDIRVPLKPIASLNNAYTDGSPAYSPSAVAHNGPAWNVEHTPDGLHLLSWGGTGFQSAATLRMWALDASGGKPCASSAAQPRPINFGSQPSARGRPSPDGPPPLAVRMAVGRGSMRLHAWGAEGALVFVPVGESLMVAVADSVKACGDSRHLQRLLKRHFSKIRACAWNPIRQELYTAGMDSNLNTWPLFPNQATDNISVEI